MRVVQVEDMQVSWVCRQLLQLRVRVWQVDVQVCGLQVELIDQVIAWMQVEEEKKQVMQQVMWMYRLKVRVCWLQVEMQCAVQLVRVRWRDLKFTP